MKLTPQNSRLCHSGAAACLEEHLGYPLQRVVCFLHHLEKPFEHLFEYYDGKSAGPDTWSGPIGKLIEGDEVHEREVVNFDVIENQELLCEIDRLPVKVLQSLSRDVRLKGMFILLFG